MPVERFRVVPPPKRAYVAAAVIVVLMAAGVLMGAVMGRDVDPRFALIALGAGLLIAAIMRRREVSFDGRVLTVKAGLHTRRTPRENLDVAGARIVDLDDERELRPLLRTGGMGLPGFRAGHFRTRRFRKTFCLLTEWRRVLALPERDGKLLLLSLERPQALIAALTAVGSDTTGSGS